MIKKILFVLPSLEAGGAERIITFISQNLDDSKFDCMLLVIGNRENAAYTTDNVSTEYLNKKRVLMAIPSIINYIRKKDPDIVLSSIGYLNTVMGLVAPFFRKTKFVIREASVISAYREFENNLLHDVLAKIAFPNVDAVICQSKDMAVDFNKLYKIPENRLHIINNPITGDVVSNTNGIIDKQDSYITIGRLSKEKGHERLLRILSNLEHDFTYTIIGKGPEKENIFTLAKTLGLDEKIKYIEHTTDVYKYLNKNDVFLQGSFVEGFPNGVLESCSVGTPVIAFRAPGGTSEIIEHGENGYLVDTESEFTNYLKTHRIWKRQDVMNSVNNKFAKETILGAYENLFDIL